MSCQAQWSINHPWKLFYGQIQKQKQQQQQQQYRKKFEAIINQAAVRESTIFSDIHAHESMDVNAKIL